MYKNRYRLVGLILLLFAVLLATYYFSEIFRAQAQQSLRIILDKNNQEISNIVNQQINFLLKPDNSKVQLIKTNEINFIKNKSEKEAVNNALATMNVSLSQFEENVDSRALTAYLAAPIFKNSALIGIAVTSFELQSLAILENNIQSLGKTAVIQIGTIVDKKPVMLFSSSKKEFSGISDTLIRSITGHQGLGIIKDERGKAVLAAWQYLPGFNAGMIVKIDRSEIYKKITYLRLVSLLLIVVILLGILKIFHLSLKQIGLSKIKIHAKILSQICILFMLFFLFGLGCYYSYLYLKIQNQAKENVITQAKFLLNSTQQQISQLLTQQQIFADNIASDLQLKILAPDDLLSRLQRTLKELPDSKRISASINNTRYDFIKEEGDIEKEVVVKTSSLPKKGWYYNDTTHELDYTVFINDHEWIQISIDAGTLQSMLSSLHFLKTGSIFLTTRDGKFIFHTIEDYYKKSKYIHDLADETNESQLKDFESLIKEKSQGVFQFTNRTAQNDEILLFQTIPEGNLTLIIEFLESEMGAYQSKLDKYMALTITIFLISIILVIILATNLAKLDTKHAKLASFLVAMAFIIGILILWLKMYYQPVPQEINQIPVYDKVSVQSILASNLTNVVKPLEIPTGITIRGLRISDLNYFEISGLIWQEYPTNYQGLMGFQFAKTENTKINEVLREKRDNVELIVWNFTTTVFGEHRQWRFPFDFEDFNLTILPASLDFNGVFIPDFKSYRYTNPTLNLGIDTELLSKYIFRSTYFAYKFQNVQNVIGPQETNKFFNKPQLTYRVIIQRNVTDAILVYIFPLALILGCAYLVILIYSHVSEVKTGEVLFIFITLFFPLIFLHREIRTTFFMPDVLYIEYLILFAYVLIFVLIFNTFMYRVEKGFEIIKFKKNLLAIVSFWPLVTGVWYFITLYSYLNIIK